MHVRKYIEGGKMKVGDLVRRSVADRDRLGIVIAIEDKLVQVRFDDQTRWLFLYRLELVNESR
jgi:hypothetical protein